MDIVYLKLNNGDELFANRISEEGDTILLDEVMVMEIIHSENDIKYMFMTRYTQYCDHHSISINRSQIVYMNTASEIVQNHYFVSVLYANTMGDIRFQDGIVEASRYLSALIKKKVNQKSSERDLGEVTLESATKH